jgi:hypothetical protein
MSGLPYFLHLEEKAQASAGVVLQLPGASAVNQGPSRYRPDWRERPKGWCQALVLRQSRRQPYDWEVYRACRHNHLADDAMTCAKATVAALEKKEKVE